MTTARRELVDVEVTRWYHCISRCVRRAFLCGDGFEHRKQWIEDRLEALAGCFAVSVAGFAAMDNHLHVLVRLDPEDAKEWSDEEVVRRWITAYPPRTLDMDDEAIVAAWVVRQAQDEKRVAAFRERLQSLGWFMKALKEPLARMANREDNCKGTFWESRYKSIAVLDEEALLATCAYIDLNPVAAGAAALPETSKHTSIRQRVQHVREKGEMDSLKEARHGSVAASRAIGSAEQDHWLLPIENRKRSRRRGMLETLSLGSYLLLVDYTSRLVRNGKARVSAEVAGVLDRIGSSAEFWSGRLCKMLKSARLHGRYFAGQRACLQSLAAEQGHHHLANLSPQPSG